MLKNRLKLGQIRPKVYAQDVAIFLRQFATLLNAGVPLIQSCDLLETSQLKQTLREIVSQIRAELCAGKKLHLSMQTYPQYFNAFTCKMIQLGEHTGKLDSMLLTVAQYWEKKIAFKKQFQRILFYPCLLLISAICITLGLFLFVIPHFATLFDYTETPLPTLTRILFQIATALKISLFPLFAAIVIATISISFYLHQKNIPLKMHCKRVLLALPVITTYWHKMILIQFARNLSISLRAGMPITESLMLTLHPDHPQSMSLAIARLRNKMNSGLSLHKSMAITGFFPSLMVQMIKIGEDTGTLETMLEKSADFFEDEIETKFAHLSKLLEPLIMLIVGVLIGGLVIGMYLPIFKLGSAL